VPGLSNASFPGEVTLVNVWASWCIPCADEVPFLEKLSADKRIKLVGINYKDPTGQRAPLPQSLRQSVCRRRHRRQRRTSIDWGVYGVPETYLIGRDGHHRLQTGRAGHRRQSRPGAGAGNRQGNAR